MSFLQRPLEDKLSSLLGAEVKMHALEVSLRKGTVLARDITVGAGDPAGPLLTIRSIQAEVSIARLLKKEFAIKSLAIEGAGPSARASRGWDHESSQSRSGFQAEARPRRRSPARRRIAPASGAWRRKRYRSVMVKCMSARAIPDHSPYHISLEQLSGQITRSGADLAFALSSDSAGRRDPDGELGRIRVSGRFLAATDLTKLASAGVEAVVEIGEALKTQINSPAISSREVQVQLDGTIDLAIIAALIPPGLGPLTAASMSGLSSVSLKGRYDPQRGLHLSQLSLSGADLTVALHHHQVSRPVVR